MRDERIDAAVSSDLLRAVETARLVLGERELALRFDPDWREMRFGDWEGLTWEEILAAHPEVDPGSTYAPRAYAPANGESFDALCERVARAVDRFTAELPEDGVGLVATHAGPLHALLQVLLRDVDVPALSVRFLTASITRFRRSKGVWTLTRLNETAQVAP